MEPVRETDKADAAWQTRERDHTNKRMSYDVQKK
jgi:hypothetical protein